MGQYKVIQDIEAEDKLFGPLTLKQFIFACITMVTGYLSFWSVINGLVFLLVVFLPPTLFFGLLAFPWSKDQPTEVWMMAKLRFYFRPRRRIWDQDGIKELVTVTVPKHEEKIYTDGLSNTEVKSRLRALADTIDSRGWAVKNVNVNLNSQSFTPSRQSDRLIDPTSTPQQVAEYDIKPDDDIYDEQNNPTAQHFEKMIEQSSQQHKQQIVSQLQQSQATTATPDEPAQQQKNDYWFMRQPHAPTTPGTATFEAAPIVTPGQAARPTPAKSDSKLTPEEQAALDKIHENQKKPNPMNSHLKTIKPLSEQTAEQSSQNNIETQSKKDAPTDKTAGNQSANADILNFAHNDDLSVETIARQANKKTGDGSSTDEVIVSLH